MSPPTLSQLYFRWLYNKVCETWDPESPYSYIEVCEHMHRMQFKTLVPHDTNRAADALELRNSYLRRLGPDQEGPTIFEVLVALAGRARDMDEVPEQEWFFEFLENLGLSAFHDLACLSRFTGLIDRNLQKFNDRRYLSNGRGGLFPLRRPVEDQRNVELWYQMGAYINQRTRR